MWIDAAESKDDCLRRGGAFQEIRRQRHQLDAIGNGFDDEPVEIDVGRDVDNGVQTSLHLT